MSIPLHSDYRCIESHQSGGIASSGLRYWIDGVSTAGSPSFRDDGSGLVWVDKEWQTATIDVSDVKGVRSLYFKVSMNRDMGIIEYNEADLTYLIDDVTAWSKTEPHSPIPPSCGSMSKISQSHAGVPNAKITLSDSGKYVYTDAYGNAYDFLFKGPLVTLSPTVSKRKATTIMTDTYESIPMISAQTVPIKQSSTMVSRVRSR